MTKEQLEAGKDLLRQIEKIEEQLAELQAAPPTVVVNVARTFGSGASSLFATIGTSGTSEHPDAAAGRYFISLLVSRRQQQLTDLNHKLAAL